MIVIFEEFHPKKSIQFLLLQAYKFFIFIFKILSRKIYLMELIASARISSSSNQVIHKCTKRFHLRKYTLLTLSFAEATFVLLCFFSDVWCSRDQQGPMQMGFSPNYNYVKAKLNENCPLDSSGRKTHLFCDFFFCKVSPSNICRLNSTRVLILSFGVPGYSDKTRSSLAVSNIFFSLSLSLFYIILNTFVILLFPLLLSTLFTKSKHRW